MKLRAVRLSEVGHFRQGVALEGFSGALDVVAGPNEMGKSTIFRAIETVFQTAYTGTAAAIQELAPAQGGAPLIEVEFELGDRLWRLRKRYLAQKMAELVDLSGRETLRGADAENRLLDLVAGRLGRKRMLDLLWVRQRHSLELPKDDKSGDISKSLGRLIENEISDAAGAGLARRVKEATTFALNELVTPANRARARVGKPYKAALEERDRAKIACAAAVAAVRAAEQRLADLTIARAEAAKLRDPAAALARDAALAALRKSFEDATRAGQALQRATLVVEAKQAAHDQAQNRLQELTDGVAEVERLRATASLTAAELATAAQDVESLEAEGRAVQARHVDAHCREALCQATIDRLARCEQRLQLLSRRDDLARRLAAVTAATARIAELDAALAAEPVDDAVLADLLRTQNEIERWQTQLNASLPRVRVDYLAEAAGRINVAGAIVAVSGEIEPAAMLVLDVAGVGRITVAAPSAAADDLMAKLDRAKQQLQSALVRANVADLATAELRVAVRHQLGVERQRLAATVTAEAPDGVLAIERALSVAAAQYETLDRDLTPPEQSHSQLVDELAALRAVSKQLDGLAQAIQAALLDASKRQARLASEQAGLVGRLARVEAVLPLADARAAELVARADAVARAKADLNTAVLERAAWSSGVLAPAALAVLKLQIDAAVAAEAGVTSQLQNLALEIKGFEGALLRDRQDGVMAVLEEARAALETAEARVAAFEREVAELDLLERLLGAEAQAARASELKPVIDRLQQYAAHVLPAAKFELGDMLAVSGLEREGLSLAGNRLSGGTAEQIAVLVRLSYARLLAEQGEALPLVLDDALVYADAGRFSAMFMALEEAARHHQVIMLTCHHERVAALGPRPAVKMVDLKVWTPAEAASLG